MTASTKRNTNNILMLAYITFIFVSVFTRHLYDSTKWSHIISAITVASWIIVLSDLLNDMAIILQEAISTIKEGMESLLFGIRRNLSIGIHLEAEAIGEYGEGTGKTIKQTLERMELSAKRSLSIVKKYEGLKNFSIIASQILLYVGFVLFFCTLLFDPVFNFFNGKLESMSAIAFGMILAGQYLGNILRCRIHEMGEELAILNESMDVINKTSEREAATHAD